MVTRESLTWLSKLSACPAWSWISTGLIVPLQSCCEWALKERKGVLERTGAVFGRGESPFCHLLTSPKHTSSQFKHACLVIVIQVAMVLHGKDKTPTCVRSTLDARLLCFETFKLGGGGYVCAQTEIGVDEAKDQLLCQMWRRRWGACEGFSSGGSVLHNRTATSHYLEGKLT